MQQQDQNQNQLFPPGLHPLNRSLQSNAPFIEPSQSINIQIIKTPQPQDTLEAIQQDLENLLNTFYCQRVGIQYQYQAFPFSITYIQQEYISNSNTLRCYFKMDSQNREFLQILLNVRCMNLKNLEIQFTSLPSQQFQQQQQQQKQMFIQQNQNQAPLNISMNQQQTEQNFNLAPFSDLPQYQPAAQNQVQGYQQQQSSQNIPISQAQQQLQNENLVQQQYGFQQQNQSQILQFMNEKSFNNNNNNVNTNNTNNNNKNCKKLSLKNANLFDQNSLQIQQESEQTPEKKLKNFYKNASFSAISTGTFNSKQTQFTINNNYNNISNNFPNNNNLEYPNDNMNNNNNVNSPFNKFQSPNKITSNEKQQVKPFNLKNSSEKLYDPFSLGNTTGRKLQVECFDKWFISSQKKEDKKEKENHDSHSFENMIKILETQLNQLEIENPDISNTNKKSDPKPQSVSALRSYCKEQISKIRIQQKGIEGIKKEKAEKELKVKRLENIVKQLI